MCGREGEEILFKTHLKSISGCSHSPPSQFLAKADPCKGSLGQSESQGSLFPPTRGTVHTLQSTAGQVK